jgi:hypothetical protein
MDAPALRGAVADFLASFTHEVLYQRGLYSPDLFARWCVVGIEGVRGGDACVLFPRARSHASRLFSRHQNFSSSLSPQPPVRHRRPAVPPPHAEQLHRRRGRRGDGACRVRGPHCARRRFFFCAGRRRPFISFSFFAFFLVASPHGQLLVLSPPTPLPAKTPIPQDALIAGSVRRFAVLVLNTEGVVVERFVAALAVRFFVCFSLSSRHAPTRRAHTRLAAALPATHSRPPTTPLSAFSPSPLLF